MCGRYTMSAPAEDLWREFDLAGEPTAIDARYNIAPTQPVAILPASSPRELRFVLWGMVPYWAKTIGEGNRLINLRDDTLRARASFDRQLERRCLVIADGFYEWKNSQVHLPRAKRPKVIKTPVHIRLAESRLFAFAGLYDDWRAPDGTVLRSCTIITTEPADAIAPIHDRMPVILPRETRERWLSPLGKEELLAMLVPHVGPFVLEEASRLVNSPDNEGPELLVPETGSAPEGLSLFSTDVLSPRRRR
jgi:putative SOS response-associated peptidase YedK